MYLDFSSLFHQSSKDRSSGGRNRVPLDAEEWPAEWRHVSYKVYPRFPSKPLADDAEGGLWDIMGRRASALKFEGGMVGLRELSLILKYSCGIVRVGEDRRFRAQPSGGALYPIEAYALLFSVTGIPSGVYHYNVKEHALDVLWERPFGKEDIARLFTYPWVRKASFALVLTGIFGRNQAKYGERGYRQILIEAGAITQNAYLASTELGVGCCAMDGVLEPAIEKLIDIDGVSESVLFSMVFGK